MQGYDAIIKVTSIKAKDFKFKDFKPRYVHDSEYIGAKSMTPARRISFLAARSLVRTSLMNDFGYAAKDAFQYTKNGKPFIIGGPAFSYAHCDKDDRCYVALFMSKDGPVGVDIEPKARHANWQRLLAKRFNAEDRGMMEHVTPEELNARMTHLWTAKEAVTKMEGGTISRYLNQLSLAPCKGTSYAGKWRVSGSTPAGRKSLKIHTFDHDILPVTVGYACDERVSDIHMDMDLNIFP